MPPKKATGAAAAAKEQSGKKVAAAPAHASYKGEFACLNTVASSRKRVHHCLVSILTLHARYDQGRYRQRESILFATTSVPLIAYLVAECGLEVGERDGSFSEHHSHLESHC